MSDDRVVETPGAEPWITTADTPDAIVVRGLVFLLLMGGALVLAYGARDAAGAWVRGVTRAVREAVAGPAPPEWARAEWLCGRCRTWNRRRATKCERCRGDRASSELRPAAPEPIPDAIPETVSVQPGSIVILEHNAAAHSDALANHWRLRVNGTIAGAAARRDGAAALLRAVRGTDTVLFDRHGTGYAGFAREALVAAFEGPRLPLDDPCPEAAEPAGAAHPSRA